MNITKHIILYYYLPVLFLFSHVTIAENDPLTRLWKSAYTEKIPPMPSDDNRKRLITLFEQCISTTNTFLNVSELLVRHNLKITYFTHPNGPFIVISGVNKENYGIGLFILRLGNNTTPALISCPHSFRDYHTGKIGIQLFLESNTKALFINTAHRDIGDFSHLTESYFNIFSKVFSRLIPKNVHLQLHGFAAKKRTSESGKTAEIIISNGSQYPTQTLWDYHQKLSRNFSPATRLYPVHTKELGGTTNILARWMAGEEKTDFVHIELSLSTRLRLLNDRTTRDTFLNCLGLGNAQK